MRKVIYVGEEPKEEKGVEFTHYLDRERGWMEAICSPLDFDKIVYLGSSKSDGDMFAAYRYARILIFKGHLNNGTF